MGRKKIIRTGMVIIVVILASLLVIPSCAPAKKPTPAKSPAKKAPEFVPVGYALSLTGAHANQGKYYKDAYELAVKQVNEEGGVYIKRYDKKIPIKLIGYDDESKPEKCVGLYEKLITVDKCPIVLGPYSSTIVFSVIPTCEKNGIPVVQGGGSSMKIFKQGWNTVHAVLPTTEHYADAVWDFFASLPPEKRPKKAAVLQEDSIVGESVVAGCKREAKKTDIDLDVIGPYPREVKDMSPVVRKAEAADADVILDAGHFYGDSLMLSTIRERGLYFKLEYLLVSIGMEDFFKAAGPKGNYVTGYGCFHPESGYSKKFGFTKAYKGYSGRLPDYHAALGYSAAQVVIDCLKRAETLKSEDILKALNRTDMTTVLGPMSFTKEGLPTKMPVLLLQHQAKPGEKIGWDTLEVVWPPEAQTAKPIYPRPRAE